MAMNAQAIRVLLVDADQDDYLLFQEMLAELEARQFELDWVTTYEEALDLIGQKWYDVCFLNHQLGDHTGLELLRRAIAMGCTAPLILLTGQNNHELDLETMKAGAADYLDLEHCDAPMLERSIRYCLERAQTMKTLRRRNHELTTLNQITANLNLFTRSDELFDQVPQLIWDALGYPLVSVWLNENGQPTLRNYAGVENRPPLAVLAAAPYQVLKTGHSVYFSGAETGKAAPGLAVIAVPLLRQAKLYGELAIHSPYWAFQESDQVVLETLALQISTTLDRIYLFESVEREERQLEAVLRGVASAIFGLDSAGRLRLLNPAGEQLFSRQPAQAEIGKRLPTNSGYADLLQLAESVRRSGHQAQGEVAWPDQRVFTVSMTPVADGGQVAVLNDVTHFKELQRVKDEFIATVSHDLKTPLTAIMGYANLLKISGGLNGEGTNYVDSIQRAATRMHLLVHGLLELTQLDLGMGIKREPCDLHQLLTDLMCDFRLQAEAKQQKLTLHFEDTAPDEVPNSPWCVMADMFLLNRVMHNLVSNALKYTPVGGQINITAERHPQKHVAEIQIQDNGLGISPANQPFIFDKFYRVKTPETKHIEGTGLGLAIVKTIVEQHGGHIWVESQGVPGKGSCFGFNLPLAAYVGPQRLSDEQWERYKQLAESQP